MLCGLTRLVSRIKHLLFFSFSKKYRPFEHLKCHECLWCKFFDDCKKEHDYMLGLDEVSNSFHSGETHAKHEEIVIGEPIESSVYGKTVSKNPADYVDWNAMDDYLNKHL